MIRNFKENLKEKIGVAKGTKIQNLEMTEDAWLMTIEEGAFLEMILGDGLGRPIEAVMHILEVTIGFNETDVGAEAGIGVGEVLVEIGNACLEFPA